MRLLLMSSLNLYLDRRRPSLILRRSRSVAVTHSLPSPSYGLHSGSCSWRHDALVLSAPIATLLRIGQKWHLRARYSKLYFLKFLISENVTFDLIGRKNKGVMTSRTWPWMKSIRRGRERVRDRERPRPSENQTRLIIIISFSQYTRGDWSILLAILYCTAR